MPNLFSKVSIRKNTTKESCMSIDRKNRHQRPQEITSKLNLTVAHSHNELQFISGTGTGFDMCKSVNAHNFINEEDKTGGLVPLVSKQTTKL